MTIEKLTPEWGKRHLPGTLAGDPDAAFSLCVAMGNEQRGVAAVALWDMQIPVPAYRAFLQSAWNHDHHHVMAAAGSYLPDLFEYADFDTSALPDRLTVWRGTAGIDHHAAADGPSWTTSRPMACWFAMRHTDRLGAPLVLRREVDRWEVAMHSNDRDEDEVVLLEEFDELPEIDGTPEDWRRLYEEQESIIRACNRPKESTR